MALFGLFNAVQAAPSKSAPPGQMKARKDDHYKRASFSMSIKTVNIFYWGAGAGRAAPKASASSI